MTAVQINTPRRHASNRLAAICVGLVFISTLINPVRASCKCHYGSVDIAEPQCVCACYPGYLQPRCLYKATDMVPMGIYVNITTSRFDSFNMTSTLVWGMSVASADSSNSVSFVFARTTPLSYVTYTRYLIRGDYAQSLLWDFKSGATWQASVGIVGVYEEIILSTSGGTVEVDTTTVLYESADKKVVVTISTVAWAVAALIFTLVITCIDNLFLHNTEAEVESIQALMDEQQQQMRIMRAQRRGVSNGEVQGYDQRHHSDGVRHVHVSPGGHPTKNPLHHSSVTMDY